MATKKQKRQTAGRTRHRPEAEAEEEEDFAREITAAERPFSAPDP
jgi:hypothetical protein